MSFDANAKAQIVSDYARSESDTGSPEVQVALLTGRIQYLTDHFKALLSAKLKTAPSRRLLYPEKFIIRLGFNSKLISMTACCQWMRVCASGLWWNLTKPRPSASATATR